jgi:hypothetical protein
MNLDKKLKDLDALMNQYEDDDDEDISIDYKDFQPHLLLSFQIFYLATQFT